MLANNEIVIKEMERRGPPGEIRMRQFGGDADFESRADILVEQTKALVRLLGVDEPDSRTPEDGTKRFKEVSHAYFQLASLYQRTREGAEFGNTWANTKVEGRNGDCLLARLHELMMDFRKAGEANRQRI
jgi:hypothetical protein